MKRLKVAIIGGGPISAFVHMPALAAMPDKFEFVALADADEFAGQKLKEKYHFNHYLTHLDMLDKEPDLDIVDICVAPIYHHMIAYDVAQRGININLEKPISMTLPMTDFVLDAVRANNIHFQISENYPLMPWDLIIEQMLNRQMFGDLATARVASSVNEISFDIGVHLYSQLRAFMRCAPRTVTAAMAPSKLVPEFELNRWREFPGFGERAEKEDRRFTPLSTECEAFGAAEHIHDGSIGERSAEQPPGLERSRSGLRLSAIAAAEHNADRESLLEKRGTLR